MDDVDADVCEDAIVAADRQFSRPEQKSERFISCSMEWLKSNYRSHSWNKRSWTN